MASITFSPFYIAIRQFCGTLNSICHIVEMKWRDANAIGKMANFTLNAIWTTQRNHTNSRCVFLPVKRKKKIDKHLKTVPLKSRARNRKQQKMFNKWKCRILFLSNFINEIFLEKFPFHFSSTFLGHDTDYLNLALRDGGVSLTMGLANGKQEMHIKPARVRFDDHQWHKVTVHRRIQEVCLMCSTVVECFLHAPHFYTNNIIIHTNRTASN